MFTTFWFSRLTSKPSPIEAKKDPIQRRHDRVKRWTRKVNIFEKDFVVVPVNENSHWYLVIICYPGQVGCKKMEDDTECRVPKSQRKRTKAKTKVSAPKYVFGNEDSRAGEPEPDVFGLAPWSRSRRKLFFCSFTSLFCQT